MIRCLQDHVEEEAFSSECKEEVTRDQIRSNQDYRRARSPFPFDPVMNACMHLARCCVLATKNTCINSNHISMHAGDTQKAREERRRSGS